CFISVESFSRAIQIPHLYIESHYVGSSIILRRINRQFYLEVVRSTFVTSAETNIFLQVNKTYSTRRKCTYNVLSPVCIAAAVYIKVPVVATGSRFIHAVLCHARKRTLALEVIE